MFTAQPGGPGCHDPPFQSLRASLLVASSDALVTNSFLLLLVRPGAPSSFLLLVAMPLLLQCLKSEHISSICQSR